MSDLLIRNARFRDNKVRYIGNNINTDLLGEPMFDSIPVDKSFEGKMLMFSASQYHAVYPFYTSDEERITVSGNLKFKTNLD